MTVICKKTGQRFVVLEVSELKDGRAAYIVCKETANRKMGSFKIAQEAVDADFK